MQLYADTLRQSSPLPDGVQPQHRYSAPIRLAQTDDTLDRRRLAGAVRSDDPEDFTRLYGKRHVSNRHCFSVRLADPFYFNDGLHNVFPGLSSAPEGLYNTKGDPNRDRLAGLPGAGNGCDRPRPGVGGFSLRQYWGYIVCTGGLVAGCVWRVFPLTFAGLLQWGRTHQGLDSHILDEMYNPTQPHT